ncbi:hypothetical protein [Streptomyces sp. NPDC006193]|uniref:hypothetical protein n=1 Tax=Streptomyces sp. NPDC006193 TaxID=3155717 RepID=UPI0033AE2697
MTEEMPRSAGGQTLGYLYQCEWVLVELAQRWLKDAEATLRMEMLDDIDLLHGSVPVELVQSKHHGGQGEIDSTSADLWRSVNSWCDALEILGDAPLPLLRLVTTQQVSAGSLLEKLRRPGASSQLDVHAVAGLPGVVRHGTVQPVLTGQDAHDPEQILQFPRADIPRRICRLGIRYRYR